ncbi:MAG TPA: hypothetical protein VII41_10155, partial [Steroidobacteraceae bacterium]
MANSRSRLRRFGSLLVSLMVAGAALAALVLAPWWLLLGLLGLLGLWSVATRVGRQAWSVTEVGLATIPQRLGA